jgi:hypothetical protein
MPIKKISLVLNTDDPVQDELYCFLNKRLVNGKKRNKSTFIRTLVDREYQKYLQQNKKRPSNERPQVFRSSGGIKIDLSQ